METKKSESSIFNISADTAKYLTPTIPHAPGGSKKIKENHKKEDKDFNRRTTKANAARINVTTTVVASAVSELRLDGSRPTQVKLCKGTRVKVWWPSDACSYSATIAKTSKREIELLYDDGERRIYPLNGSILRRIAIGQTKTRHILSPACLAGNYTKAAPSAPQPKLYEGERTKIWCPADSRSHEATIGKLSNTKIELIYSNGIRKTYPRDLAILSRITIGKFPPALARKVASGEISLTQAQVERKIEKAAKKVDGKRFRKEAAKELDKAYSRGKHVTVPEKHKTYRHSGLWLTQANEAAEKVRRKSVEKAVARRKSVEKAEAKRIAKEAADKPNNKYTLNGLLSTIRVPKAHNSMSDGGQVCRDICDEGKDKDPLEWSMENIDDIDDTLSEGKNVKVWWPADGCSYRATIDKLSDGEIELVYDDGMRKSYPRDEAILSRITIGELPPHLIQSDYFDDLKPLPEQKKMSLVGTLEQKSRNPDNGTDTHSDQWEAAEENIYEGKHVDVWWPADGCSYRATINKLSDGEIELVYDDGMRKSYPRDEAILSRITIGEVVSKLAANEHVESPKQKTDFDFGSLSMQTSFAEQPSETEVVSKTAADEHVASPTQKPGFDFGSLSIQTPLAKQPSETEVVSKTAADEHVASPTQKTGFDFGSLSINTSFSKQPSETEVVSKTAADEHVASPTKKPGFDFGSLSIKTSFAKRLKSEENIDSNKFAGDWWQAGDSSYSTIIDRLHAKGGMPIKKPYSPRDPIYNTHDWRAVAVHTIDKQRRSIQDDSKVLLHKVASV